MRIFILAVAFFITSHTHSQTYQHQMLTGGSVQLKIDREAESGSKYSEITIAPDFGYFIVNNLAVGVKPEIRYWKTTATNFLLKYRTLSFAPFVRFYILQPKNRFNIATYAAYKVSSAKDMVNGFRQRHNGYALGAGPVVFINPSLAVELILNYEQDKLNLSPHWRRSIYLSGGLQAHIPRRKDQK